MSAVSDFAADRQEQLSSQARQRRARWLKTLHQWHWISAGFSLIGLLLFSLSGFTLNHAASIEGKPQVDTRLLKLPAQLLPLLSAPAATSGATGPADATRPLSPAISRWLSAELRTPIGAQAAEWSAGEVYLPLPRPGGDAWLRIQTGSGDIEYEATDRGWIAYLNDLHKGRNTGEAWRWFIDLFAFACVAFALTGLCILKLHAANRPATWPVLTLGLVLPLLLALLFIH